LQPVWLASSAFRSLLGQEINLLKTNLPKQRLQHRTLNEIESALKRLCPVPGIR
jgi:hypothetical protein